MPTNNRVQTGFLDPSGHPCIKVKVYGISLEFAREFEAMIDTGFTGFLMMPIISAFPLGLTLCGTSNYTLADGSSSAKLQAFGNVVCDGQDTMGIVVLETSNCGLLLGMDYLRLTKRALMVSPSKGAVLVDEDMLDQMAGSGAASAPSPS